MSFSFKKVSCKQMISGRVVRLFRKCLNSSPWALILFAFHDIIFIDMMGRFVPAEYVLLGRIWNL